MSRLATSQTMSAVRYDTRASGGEFVRRESIFRNTITPEAGEFRAEPGRYHLYVSLACPWAHRTIILRKLKGLEEAIGMTVVDPVRDARSTGRALP